MPALARALRWCRAHRPPHEPAAALLWGDVRFENMILDDDGQPRAVLDWDMTSVGAPEHDLAWFTSLDFTMQALFGKRTEGFPDRQQTIERFGELSGRPVLDLEWYETLAMVRSTAIMTRISVLRGEAGEPVMLPDRGQPHPRSADGEVDVSDPTTPPGPATTAAQLVRLRAEDDTTGLLFEDRAWTWREVVTESEAAG